MPAKKSKAYALNKAVSQLGLIQARNKKTKTAVPKIGYETVIKEDGTIVLDGPFVTVRLPPKRLL